ncbi:hypothetical protein PG995_006080 [Apiospora arundinis]
MDPNQQPQQPAQALQQPQQHQPYQPPYTQPYPAGVHPMQQPTATGPPPVSRPWHNAKIALLSVSVVFCIILIGISIALAVDPKVLSLQVVWIAPEAAVAIIWSVAELITICARGGQRGIHPGAHVALHLLFWLAFLIGAGLTAYLVAVNVGYDSYYDSYYYTRYFNLRFYIRSLQAELAFLILLIMIHFTLFVRACIETNRRNRKVQPVFFPVNTYNAPYAVPQQGMPQMLQQPQQQQPVYPMQPQQAHMSANYDQPTKEVQPQYTGSTQAPAQTHDDGMQHVAHGQ